MRDIDTLVIHRTEAGFTGSEVAVNENAAYQLFIARTGRIDWALSPQGFDLGFSIRGNHAIGWNTRSIGIAVYGCFDTCPDGKALSRPPLNLIPTPQQLDALYVLVLGLQWWLGRSLYVAGHTELPNATAYPGKRCPGHYLDLDTLRARTGTSLPPF